MIIAADIGNSTVSVGILKEGHVINSFKFDTKKDIKLKELEEIVTNDLMKNKVNSDEIKGTVVSSVVPEVDDSFNKVFSKLFGKAPLFVDYKKKLGIKIKLKNKEQVGADRLVNASYAHFLSKSNVIVIDFGTATTFDLVTKQGDFVGGAIAPGVKASLDALNDSTSMLNRVELKSRPKTTIGKDTESAIRSGVYNGYIGLVNNIVSQMEKEAGVKVKVIATGGAFLLFKNDLMIVESYDKHLTLKGLGRIYSLNTL